MRKPCPQCAGTGKLLCSTCVGTGYHNVSSTRVKYDHTIEYINDRVPCSSCDDGYIKCPSCRGSGQVGKMPVTSRNVVPGAGLGSAAVFIPEVLVEPSRKVRIWTGSWFGPLPGGSQHGRYTHYYELLPKEPLYAGPIQILQPEYSARELGLRYTLSGESMRMVHR
jgi:hypothetical protein